MRAGRYASSVKQCTKYAAYAKAAYASFAFNYRHLHMCTIPSHICTTYSHISDELNVFTVRVSHKGRDEQALLSSTYSVIHSAVPIRNWGGGGVIPVAT